MNTPKEHLKQERLIRECSKLDPNEEQKMADMGLDEDLKSWPNKMIT